jgi:hypothetical protein
MIAFRESRRSPSHVRYLRSQDISARTASTHRELLKTLDLELRTRCRSLPIGATVTQGQGSRSGSARERAAALEPRRSEVTTVPAQSRPCLLRHTESASSVLEASTLRRRIDSPAVGPIAASKLRRRIDGDTATRALAHCWRVLDADGFRRSPRNAQLSGHAGDRDCGYALPVIEKPSPGFGEAG